VHAELIVARYISNIMSTNTEIQKLILEILWTNSK